MNHPDRAATVAGAVPGSTPTPVPGPGPGPAVSAALRLGRRARTALPEVTLVVGVLVLLECLVFWGYFKGYAGPQFDFLGTYNTEAYSWWHDGGFFAPPEWVPYTWGGYPSAVSLQNASWYLPVGIPASLVEYDLHIASMLQALHVAAGALGVYVLARAWRLGRLTALLGLVAGFFAPGFFANAQHVDIVRGYAWAPWLLLLLSPAWPWRRWWAVPAATFLLWQALVGIYPGILVALVYLGIVWVAAFQVIERPRLREYLLPLACSGALAGLLAALKFVPAIALRGAGSPSGAEDSAFDLGILGTIFFPYDGDNLPTDMSMRSFFIPATCLALLALVPWRSRRVWVVTLTGAVAAAMSLPIWPWFDLVGQLPGMNLSRFRASDFRPFLLLAVVLLALIGLSATLRAAGAHRATGQPPLPLALRRRGVLVYLIILLGLAAALGITQGFDQVRWSAPWTILLCAALGVAMLAGLGSSRWKVAPPDARLVTLALVALTITSGVSWAYSTTRPWLAARIAVEEATWGERVEALIDERSDPQEYEDQAFRTAVQRPERTPLDLDPVPVVEFQKQWNSAYYTGVAAVGGYTNLKGNEAFDRAMQAFQDESTAEDALAFYAAPGVAMATEGTEGTEIPDAADVERCVATHDCGDGETVVPREYEPGRFVYEISGPEAVLQLNESYYPGWTAQVCPVSGGDACEDVSIAYGPMGNIAAEVPAGAWILSLAYSTPRLGLAWQLFWIGVGAIVLWTGARLFSTIRRARRRDAPPELLPADATPGTGAHGVH